MGQYYSIGESFKYRYYYYPLSWKKWWSNTDDIVVLLPALNEEIAIGTMVLGARKYADHVGQRVLDRATNFAGRIHVFMTFNRGE